MLIVPTLRLGMPLGTLRVPVVTRSIVEHGWTRSVTGCIPTQSVGTIKLLPLASSRAGSLPQGNAYVGASLLAKASDHTPQESASATFACN
ncbi:hypothetical protein E1508_11450 [Pseudomonas moraviensis]|nr:hypothetical protein E1508_11450 [Pseudomonas moraviensis]